MIASPVFPAVAESQPVISESTTISKKSKGILFRALGAFKSIGDIYQAHRRFKSVLPMKNPTVLNQMQYKFNTAYATTQLVSASALAVIQLANINGSIPTVLNHIVTVDKMTISMTNIVTSLKQDVSKRSHLDKICHQAVVVDEACYSISLAVKTAASIASLFTPIGPVATSLINAANTVSYLATSVDLALFSLRRFY